MGVVAWEQGGDGEVYPHLALALLHDVLHTLIIGLHSGGDALVVVGVRLIGSVSHKVELHILIAPLQELLYLKLYASPYCGVCGVDSQTAIKANRLTLGTDIYILPAVVHIAHYPALGIATPVGEGTPVDTRLLTVLVAVLHEYLVLVVAEAEVPEGVDVDIYRTLVLEAVALQMVVDEVRHLNRLLECHLCSQCTPAVPAEWTSTERWELGGKCGALVAKELHTLTPVTKPPHCHSWRLDTLAHHLAVGDEVAGDGRGCSAIELQ